MPFLLKFIKRDVQMICEELGIEITEDIRIQLRKKIMKSEDYEEGVIIELARTIVTECLERVEREILENDKKLEREKKIRSQKARERKRRKVREENDIKRRKGES